MKKPSSSQSASDRPLRVRGVRRPEPDWDRFIAALIVLAMRQVEDEAPQEDHE
jgi:hypothetical protein